MDHMMPGMDGIEAVRIIRNEIGGEYAKTVPIIALTANAIIGNDEMFLNNGFQDFLTKPIDIMKMNGSINRWVRDKKREKELGLDTESRLAEGRTEEETPVLDETAEIIRTARIKGLDAEKGLERFGGDGKSYMDSLRSYALHTPPLLESARITTNIDNYAVTVHGIKGSSYGISAEAAGQWAERLEHAARAGNLSLIGEENNMFIESVKRFISDLNGLLRFIDEKYQKPCMAAPDPELLEKIRDAAENYDVSGLDRAMEELEQCTYESDADLVPWLREQIDKSEFEKIISRLMPPQEVVLFVEA
jgi:CheY-like chemotaxis protein